MFIFISIIILFIRNVIRSKNHGRQNLLLSLKYCNQNYFMTIKSIPRRIRKNAKELLKDIIHVYF